jgi:F-type H+-transporting ATPase subunit gamma
MGLEPNYHNARLIASSAISDFIGQRIDQVILIYNKFISTLTQRPIMSEIIPFKSHSNQEGNSSAAIDYIFEPSCELLLKELLPRQISNQIFQAMLSNAVGEHAARMTAMDNASNNAEDFISSLTVKMNRARQAAITTELIEIISGAEAL